MNKMHWAKGVIFSLIYNILWLSLFPVMLAYNLANTASVTIIFLIVYIFIAQPAKDLLYNLYIVRRAYRNELLSRSLEKKLHALNNLSDFQNLLNSICHHWNAGSIQLIIFYPEEKLCHLTGKSKGKWLKKKELTNRSFIKYISQETVPANIAEFPEEFQSYLNKNNVSTIVPIVYRDSLLGFFATQKEMSSRQKSILGFVAGRASIMLHSVMLKNLVPRMETVDKEIEVARKIEHLLSSQDDFIDRSFIIQKNKAEWENKMFSAIHGVAKGRSEKESWIGNVFDVLPFRRRADVRSKAPTFFLICKISGKSHRSHNLQLFGVKGYFLAVCQRSSSIQDVVIELQKILTDKDSIKLEGFAGAELGDDSIELISFGKNIRYKVDDKWMNTKNIIDLGSSNWKQVRPRRIKDYSTLLLNIRGFQLLTIRKFKLNNE